jgi:hypothetical protein
MQAEQHLFSTTPVLGRVLRNRAVERLFAAGSREAALLLAGAVEKEHPEGEEIFRRLLLLRHDTAPEMHHALWNHWKSGRFETLLKRVSPSGSWHSEFRQALVAMPASDWGNALLFMLWSLSDDDGIAEMIESDKRRHAPALEMDALFGLVRGKPERYLSLEDADFSIFEKAWLLASAVQKQRISLAVLNSRNARLVMAYDQAVREGRDPHLVIEALRLSGDHDALLDRLEGLPFSRSIEVVAFWAASGSRPVTPARRAVVERAVALYRELAAHLPVETSSPLPGTKDLFSFWNEQYRSDDSIQRDLEHPDPFRRAGALFAGARRGMVLRGRMQALAVNGSWPEKLALHHLFSVPDVKAPGEHVLWLRPPESLAGRMLATLLPGSPDDRLLFGELLERVSAEDERSVAFQHTLFRLFTLMQGYFLRGHITVDRNDDATEANAVETEDIADVQW